MWKSGQDRQHHTILKQTVTGKTEHNTSSSAKRFTDKNITFMYSDSTIIVLTSSYKKMQNITNLLETYYA